MRKHVILAVSLVAANLLAGSAGAQPAPLIIDQNRTDRSPPQIARDNNVPVIQPGASQVVRNIKPFVICDIRIHGVSPEMVSASGEAVRSFVGKSADNQTLDQISGSMARAYGQGDIALYSVLIPEQDFAKGIVNVTVVEGYVQHVNISGDVSGDLELAKAYAAQLTRENPLRKSTLQRYVALLRDVSGLEPTINVVSGNARGAVLMKIELRQKSVQFSLSVNTQGSRDLGRMQFGLGTTLYDVLQEGDATRIGFSAPTELRYFQYYTFGQTEPVGDDGAIAQLNLGYLHTRPRNSLPTGDAKTGQLTVSYPLIRSFGENLILSGSLDALDSENALLGQTFANEKVRAVRVSSAWSLQTETRTMNVALTVSLGIKGFGARVASPITSQNAFTKFNLQAAFAQQISGSWIVRLSGVGQYSSARLPVSEFIALGGGNCVRGFPAASIYGDRGAAGSVELAYRLNGFESIAEFSHKMEIYGFADEGAATLNVRPGLIKRGYSLSSAGIGTRLWLGLKTSLYVEAEKRIHVPVGISDLNHTWQLDFGLQGGF